MEMEQQHMQSLGLFGILKESLKMIYTWKKIFTQITLCLILPISLLFFAQIEASQQISSKILHNVDLLDLLFEGTENYDMTQTSDWALFFLFKITYFTLFLILSLLATSAVVYTVACVYAASEVSFTKVMRVVPKVWKRVALTALWAYLVFFIYNAVTVLTIYLWVEYVRHTPHDVWTFLVMLILYPIGFVYMTTIWLMASVVSVLEDSFGLKAMKKSNSLLKGKMWIAIFLSVVMSSSIFGTFALFNAFVADGSFSVFAKVALGKLCFMLFLCLFLLGLVIQTVLYFVCKFHHRENIDKSTLSNHLGGYLGDHVPLKNNNVQLQESHV